MSWFTSTKRSPNEAYNFAFKPSDKRRIHLLILVGLLFMVAFLAVYFQPSNRGYSWLFILLTISVTFKLFRLLHEWYHYWNVVPSSPPPATRTWSVDVFTTFCPGEPHDMVINTLRAVQAMSYPHSTYLCDEANDPYLRQICDDMGVIHVTRTDKKDAKAGNINNALQQATGEICLIIDPDHVPAPDFLDHVIPYFENPKIGFVQCVQGYYNHKESLVAYGAAEQTYTFYGPMMTCMGNYGTAQAIGANCTFRRAALDSIGGHAPGLSEDMHTAMLLHAQGWESAYVPLPLSYGLVPSTLSAYFKQQLKWSRGTFELLVTTYPKIVSKLSWRQRLHYLTMPMYYLLGVVQLIDLLIPIISLITMRLPLRLDLLLFATAYVPLLVAAFLIRQYAQRWLIEKDEAGFHILGGILSSGTWWVYLLGLVYTIFRVDVPYLPTPKRDRPQNNFVLCLPNILMVLVTFGAIGYSIYHYGRFAISNVFSQLMIGFGLLNVVILGLNILIGQEKLLGQLKNWVAPRISFQKPIFWPLRIAFWHIRYGFYRWLRLSAIPLFVLWMVLTTGLVAYTSRKKTSKLPNELRYATTQPFYYGLEPANQPVRKLIPVPDQVIVPQHLNCLVAANGNISITQPNWSGQPNQLPLLYLEPAFTASVSNRPASETELQAFLTNLQQGRHDDVLLKFANQLKKYPHPFLLSFAPEFDDTSHAWGTRQDKTLALYKQVWEHIVKLFQQQEMTSATWVWCPTQPSTFVNHYPSGDYIDWLGLDVVNGPVVVDDLPKHSFAAQYQLMHNTIRLHISYSIRHKPILITHFGSPIINQADRDWVVDALGSIHDRYPEIRATILSPEQANALKIH
ncbi:hypothetical protein GCM10028805_20430 [Spirosoma harenae]